MDFFAIFVPVVISFYYLLSMNSSMQKREDERSDKYRREQLELFLKMPGVSVSERKNNLKEVDGWQYEYDLKYMDDNEFYKTYGVKK